MKLLLPYDIETYPNVATVAAYDRDLDKYYTFEFSSRRVEGDAYSIGGDCHCERRLERLANDTISESVCAARINSSSRLATSG